MKLIIICNEGTGLTQTILDSVQKTVLPTNVNCKHCDLTAGTFGPRIQWKRALRSLPYDVMELQKDEFRNHYPGQGHQDLPAVLVKEQTEFRVLMNAFDIETMISLDHFIRTINDRLANR